jgi:RNA polymerase sigma factor for flagellar operon FliA
MRAERRGSRRLSADEGIALWKEYKAGGDPRLRDRLILTYAPLVKHLAYKRIRELPAELEVEDLISAGLEGLIGSIDRYEPSRGTTLEQYAWTRIHGAMVDELRRRDWAPRSLRQWQREAARAASRFTAIHGRAPTSQEVADALGVTVDEMHEWKRKLKMSDVASLNATVTGDDDMDVEMVETLLSDDEATDPLEVVVGRERRRRFRRAVDQLPDRERHVAVLRYVQEMTLGEIGEVLGVSESRVSQIDQQVKRRLALDLAETGVEAAVA